MARKKKNKSVGIIVALILVIGLPVVILSTKLQTGNQQHASFQNLNSGDFISQTNNPDGTMGPPDWTRNYANVITQSSTGTLTFLVTDPLQAARPIIVPDSPAQNFGELLHKQFPPSGIKRVHVALPTSTGVSLNNVVQSTASPTISANTLSQGSPQRVSSLLVTIGKVEVHFVQGTDVWETLNIGTPKGVDLVQLAKGGLASLGLTKLAAGAYAEVRIYITTASAVLVNGENVQLPIRGNFVIVRIAQPFTIHAGANTNLIVDFDAQNSVIKAGGQYLLKPVVANFLESDVHH